MLRPNKLSCGNKTGNPERAKWKARLKYEIELYVDVMVIKKKL